MPELITKGELALSLEISRGRVSQLIRRGLPIEPDGQIDLERAVRWCARNLDPFNNAGGRAWHRAREWVEFFDSGGFEDETHEPA
jgi:hypothetical protein